jgi:hypothetical protein
MGLGTRSLDAARWAKCTTLGAFRAEMPSRASKEPQWRGENRAHSEVRSWIDALRDTRSAIAPLNQSGSVARDFFVVRVPRVLQDEHGLTDAAE